MKKTLLALTLLSVLATACTKKDKDPEPTPAASTTNAMNGDWKVTVYDNTAVTAPMAATYKATATSATAGTAHFDITFDGTAHKTEDVSYVLSSSNANVVFTKTGGDYSVLSGGGTWTIDQMTSIALSMKSANGLIIKMTR